MDVMAATETLALATPTAVGWIGYIIIGGIAGWLASKVVKGTGSGIVVDIVVGIIGGFLGGFLLAKLGFDVASGRHWFTFFTAFLGAVLLLFLVRLARSASRR